MSQWAQNRGFDIPECNGLWQENEKSDRTPWVLCGGTMWNGSHYRARILKISDVGKDCIVFYLALEGAPEVWKVRWDQKDSRVFLPYFILNDWTVSQWTGVTDPVLWAQAGFSPDQARDLLALPVGHKMRPDESALELLAGLCS